jgi:hypothetical protein
LTPGGRRLHERDAPPGFFSVRPDFAGPAPFSDGDPTMARKPNYPFERMERERLKAAKVAEKQRAKAEARERAKGGGGETPAEPSDDDQA